MLYFIVHETYQTETFICLVFMILLTPIPRISLNISY